jgi:ribosomal 50S subunit-associated protein YjgA (DUF615 family)
VDGSEGIRPQWKSAGKPLAELTADELAEAIRYIENQDKSDVALLKALHAVRDERSAAGDDPVEERDESDPPVFACG